MKTKAKDLQSGQRVDLGSDDPFLPGFVDTVQAVERSPMPGNARQYVTVYWESGDATLCRDVHLFDVLPARPVDNSARAAEPRKP